MTRNVATPLALQMHALSFSPRYDRVRRLVGQSRSFHGRACLCGPRKSNGIGTGRAAVEATARRAAGRSDG